MTNFVMKTSAGVGDGCYVKCVTAPDLDELFCVSELTIVEINNDDTCNKLFHFKNTKKDDIASK